MPKIRMIPRISGRIGSGPESVGALKSGPNQPSDLGEWRAAMNGTRNPLKQQKREALTFPLDARTLMRFASKFDIESDSGCWLWTSSKNHKGYGYMTVDTVSWAAHRLSYLHHTGPIPDGLEIDHLCRVRNCVNPNHLEAVTHRVNIQRTREYSGADCSHGHPRTPENVMTYVKSSGKVVHECIPCHKAKAKRKRPCPHCGRECATNHVLEHIRRMHPNESARSTDHDQ